MSLFICKKGTKTLNDAGLASQEISILDININSFLIGMIKTAVNGPFLKWLHIWNKFVEC